MVDEQQALVLERIVNAPSTIVWRALTNISLLKQWLPLFPDFKAEVGFETRFLLGPDEKHLYLHICRVLEVIPEKRLTYTWRYEGYEGDSSVTFELFPDGDQTKVVLTHTITKEFPSDNPAFSRDNFKEGWIYTIDGLKIFAEKEVRT